MNVILSIKPEYAWEIIRGNKKVEFRKSIFKKSIKKIYIYSSAPDQKIIGYFSLKDIDSDTPINLWKKYGKVGCINKVDFFKYYSLKEKGVSLKIDKVVKFKIPLDPYQVMENFYPPQSFQYCANDL
ncbi:ASCH domain-containing protein [Leptospira noumeaensis]|uniref:ASCH domain-containing protein n=1 Tax=Leptospira noumeaensis TaxID=2484964 RepID=A0A4R9I7J3_9LEPT|nr:ASCH domain-containing protein [Leptospira noumeaensis]TGK81980.1 ASCH domain-containing protein [Leptospira noumeaensis]